MDRPDPLYQRVQADISSQFPDVRLEFSRQRFDNHVEIWVYVLSLNRFDDVQAWCREYADRQRLDEMEPEIWLLTGTWTGPWPGGDSEQEIRQLQTRRDQFRERHHLALN